MSESAGHGLPPEAIACFMARVRRNLLPPPAYGAHAPHDVTIQSTGHGSVLHARSCLSGGHSPPFSAAVRTKRLRSWRPPPHVAVHRLHAVHDVTVQWSGQGASLHCAVPIFDGQ